MACAPLTAIRPPMKEAALLLLLLPLLTACGSADHASNAHPEWGQCGFAQAQHETMRRDHPPCVAGDLPACVRAAEVYREGGYSVPRWPARAAELAWTACRGSGSILLGANA